MNVTQSYDDAVYKLVPNADALVGFGERAAVIINEFLEETPRDLPGVVTHSGEPYGFAVEANDGHITFFKDEPKAFRSPPFDKIMTVHSLFTHADSAEVSALRQRVAELSVELDRVKENWCNSDVSLRTKLRESQLAQQDGALDTYLTNNYPAAVGDSVSARAINALETMDVQLGMKSAQQDGAQPVAWRATNFSNDGNDYAYRDADDQFVNPSGESVGQALYTHADPAEVAALRQRVAELEVLVEQLKRRPNPAHGAPKPPGYNPVA